MVGYYGNKQSFLKYPAQPEANVLDAYRLKTLNPAPISKNMHFVGADIGLSTVVEGDFKSIFNLKEALDSLDLSVTPAFDYAIIDGLPSFGHLHLAALATADYVLIPVKPAPYALAGLKDLLTTVDKTRKYFNPGLKILGVVINQVDGRRPRDGTGNGENLAEEIWQNGAQDQDQEEREHRGEPGLPKSHCSLCTE